MNRLPIASLVVLLSLFPGIARVARAAGALPPLPADAKIDDILDALDQSGKNLTAIRAQLSDTMGNANLGNLTKHTGEFRFQKVPDGADRVRVTFDQRISGKLAIPEKREYVLDGPWLIDRDYDKKLESKHQVLKPGQKINLLKLGEGPFPMPIGQDKADVHKSFDVTLVPPDKTDPPQTLHLTLVPKEGSELASKFASIDAWVDRTSRMPIRIETLDAEKNDSHQVELSKLQVNDAAGLKDSDFQLPDIDGAWSTHTESDVH